MNQDVRNVRFWFASFILLILATALAVVCFLTNVLGLYVVCGLVLLAFVILYGLTTKAIIHKDGYTLVQALWLYRTCKKEGIDCRENDPISMEIIMKLASEKDFAKKLTPMQMINMLKVGRELSAQLFNKED